MPISAQTLFRNVSLEINVVLDHLASIEDVVTRHLVDESTQSAVLDLQHLDYIRQSLSTLGEFFGQLPLHVSDRDTFVTLPSLLQSAVHLRERLTTEGHMPSTTETETGDVDLF